eukprot:6764162-Heterocapsa_arctica.AAC.1
MYAYVHTHCTSPSPFPLACGPCEGLAAKTHSAIHAERTLRLFFPGPPARRPGRQECSRKRGCGSSRSAS